MAEKKRKERIGKLDTLGGVVKELGRIYRQAKRCEIDDVFAVRMAMILREIRTCLEVSELETRLRALEGEKVEPIRRVA